MYVCIFIKLHITAQSGLYVCMYVCMCLCVYGHTDSKGMSERDGKDQGEDHPNKARVLVLVHSP